jgi:choline-glycine betaine transporter
VSLGTALGLAVASGRVIEAVIIGVILVPPLALIAVWAVAWRRDQLDDAER